VLPEFQQRVVELLGDILRPALRQEDFDTEKQVILEEIRMYEDQPPFGADEKCRALHYGQHPLGRSVLGTVESITALSVESMRDYFRRRYGPENMVLAAAGRIDFDALVAGAQRYCGHWQPAEATRVLGPAAPRDGFEILHKPTATQQYTLQLAAAPAAEDGDRHAAKILAAVLGDDTGSRLYWELIDRGLAEHAGLAHGEYQRAGVLMTSLSCDPQHTAENLQRILDIYRRAEADGITATELEQAKSKIRSRIVLSSERPRGRLFTVGSEWVYRRQYRAVDEELAAMGAVTRRDVAALLSKYPLSRSTTVTIGPWQDVPAPK
jgi:predicted Zn-dependent peptidase